MSSFVKSQGIFYFSMNIIKKGGIRMHNKIQQLLSQIDCVDKMMTAKIENERSSINDQFYSQLVTTHQKVSLAEKRYHVKNACSPISSEID